MNKEDMFQFMIKTAEEKEGRTLTNKEVWLMEKSFLMGIKYAVKNISPKGENHNPEKTQH